MAQAPNPFGDGAPSIDMADATAESWQFSFPESSWVRSLSQEQFAKAQGILQAIRTVSKETINSIIAQNAAALDTIHPVASLGEETFFSGQEVTSFHYLAAYLTLFGDGTIGAQIANHLFSIAQTQGPDWETARQAAAALTQREQTDGLGFYGLMSQAARGSQEEPELVNRGTAILRATRMIQTMRREMETRGSEKPAYTVVSEFIPRINHWRYSLVALMAQNSQDVRSRSEILREYLRWEIELAALIYVNADTERQRDDVLNGLRRSRAVVETADRFGVIKTSQGDGLVESWRRFPGRGSSRETEALLAAYGDGKPKAPPKSDKGSKSSTDKSKRGGDSDSGTNNLEKEITAMSTPLSLLNVAGPAAEKHPEGVHEEEYRPPGETVMFCLP